jgi:site-specific recombinase XerD
VFVTEAGTPTTTAWFLRMVQRTGRAAKLPFPVHPHMLRHSTGYKLANDGHDTQSLAHYLGHRNLQSTARYTALAEGRFAKFWQD